MKNIFKSLLIIILFFNQTIAQEITPEPLNIGILKNSVKHYMTNGDYDKAMEAKYEEIKQYISENKKDKVKYAVAMDIDETTLSNLEFELRYGFGFAPRIWKDWVNEANAKAIPAAKKFFKWALENDIAVFFITGRRAVTDNIEDDPTTINLEKEGFTGYKKLYLKAKKGKVITIEYKSGARKEITEMGYIVIANIGDQWSDLEGGFAEKSFKLPNPMYYVD